MKTFVTGAPGWLGTRLVAHLVGALESPAGRPPVESLRCLVEPGRDRSELSEFAGAEIVEGDLRDPAAAGRFLASGSHGVLFHCAGVIHPTRGVASFLEVNVEGTKILLDAAARAGIARIVHVSSNSPFGFNRHPSDVFDERSAYRPYMGYGRSKMLAEEAVETAGRQGRFATVIVRAPWFYGPGQPARQTLFFTMIRTGKVPLVGDGENRRSMAYIDNLCQGLLLAATRAEAVGQSYWIADRRPYAMNEILATIEDVMERDFGVTPPRRRVRLPSVAADVARAIDGGLQAVGVYSQKIHVLSEMNRTIACTIERAERELGYRPEVELAEGMRRSLAWLADRGIRW